MIVGNIESRFLGVDDLPEQDRIDIHGHRIFGQGLFSLESCCDHTGVNPVGYKIHNRDDKKESGALDGMKTAESQDHSFFPLIRHFDGG